MKHEALGLKSGNEFDFLSVSKKRDQIKELLACHVTNKEGDSKGDIVYFKKSKRKVTSLLIVEFLHKANKATEKELIALMSELGVTYPFFELKLLKGSISMAKNNIRYSQEDGISPSYYEGELERLNRELNKFNKDWEHIFK